jgi:hypothetical protein
MHLNFLEEKYPKFDWPVFLAYTLAVQIVFKLTLDVPPQRFDNCATPPRPPWFPILIFELPIETTLIN